MRNIFIILLVFLTACNLKENSVENYIFSSHPFDYQTLKKDGFRIFNINSPISEDISANFDHVLVKEYTEHDAYLTFNFGADEELRRPVSKIVLLYNFHATTLSRWVEENKCEILEERNNSEYIEYSILLDGKVHEGKYLPKEKHFYLNLFY